ncbi:MAG: hypothetical protein KDD36_10855, partial [Flavobacteriales bacterium]|nr:hypothetical protein [Flavobacteriales bacterium]
PPTGYIIIFGRTMKSGMLRFNTGRSVWTTIIPFLYFAWGLLYSHMQGPFFQTRIDPEYPYLLNGLHASLFEFTHIGHLDHPGTPFQLLTGFFIRMTHLAIGQGDLYSDVFQRPEMYLSAASFCMGIITMIALTWLGRVALCQTQNIRSAVVIQAAMLLCSITFGLPARFMPERLMFVMAIILTGTILPAIFSEISPKRFSLKTGIIGGISLATKITTAPWLLLPLVILPSRKWRKNYGLITAATFLVCILPILGRFRDFINFIKHLITRDGQYGEGEAHILSSSEAFSNLFEILNDNLLLLVMLLIQMIVVVRLWIRKKPEEMRLRNIFTALTVVMLTGVAILLKHYKNYYILPVSELSALAILMYYVLIKKWFTSKTAQSILHGTVIVCVLLALLPEVKRLNQFRKDQRSRGMFTGFIQKHVGPEDYFIHTNSWQGGPVPQTGLLYGQAFVRHQNKTFNRLEPLYGNTLTYHGAGQPPRYLSVIDVDGEALIKSGKDIYFYHEPARDGHPVKQYLDSLATAHQVHISTDTVYRNPLTQQFLLRTRNTDGWNIVNEEHIGYEQFYENYTLYSDEGMGPLTVSPNLNDREMMSGYFSTRVDTVERSSPQFIIDSVKQGDLIEVTAMVKPDQGGYPGTLVVSSVHLAADSLSSRDTRQLAFLSKDWIMMRLTFEVPHDPIMNKLLIMHQYYGGEYVLVDNMVIRHMGKR